MPTKKIKNLKKKKKNLNQKKPKKIGLLLNKLYENFKKNKKLMKKKR